jgi:hypothetical protein
MHDVLESCCACCLAQHVTGIGFGERLLALSILDGRGVVGRIVSDYSEQPPVECT